MSLVIFKDRYVEQLLAEVPQNSQKYLLPSSWAQAEAPADTLLPTKLSLKGTTSLAFPDNSELKDFENSLRIYRMLPDLTPVQARDPRLWARLCHEEFWEYMQLRWDASKHATDSNRQARYIQSHYFIPQAQSRALLRNGIARLWWYAHLTRDESRDNEFELTEILLSTLDITQQLLERSLGRSRHILFGFLGFLFEAREEGLSLKRELVRELAKRLNMTGGVTLLDTLEACEISALLRAEYSKIAPPT